MKDSSQSLCCRVSLVDNIVVQPQTEMIVPGKILDNPGQENCCLMEGQKSFMERTGLMVAKTLVNPSLGNVHVRLANLSNQSVKVYKDTVVTYLEPVQLIKNETRNEVVGYFGISDGKQNTIPEHLNELFKNSSTNLNEKEKLQHFLIKHQEIFSKGEDDIGHSTLVKHKIDTGFAKLVKKYPYRIPLAKRKVAEAEIKKMKENDIIERCPQSAWNAPIVMIVKKDKSIRFCCDFRGLNEVTIKDAQPLPRIDDSIEALSGSKWFSCLDMKSGY